MGTNRKPTPLRYVNLEEWDDGPVYCHIKYQESQPHEFDDSWPYRFQHGESVWVHSTGYEWYQGKIAGQPKVGRTKKGEGLFWLVTYDRNKRRYAAPLNGELKPDTPHIKQLLEEAGALAHHSTAQ